MQELRAEPEYTVSEAIPSETNNGIGIPFSRDFVSLDLNT